MVRFVNDLYSTPEFVFSALPFYNLLGVFC